MADQAIATHSYQRQEVHAVTLDVDAAPLVWEWSERCGFATNFASRSDEWPNRSPRV